MLTNCRVSLRLVNRNPEDLIFTTFFQETFPTAYSFDATKPRVELIKAVHPRQVRRETMRRHRDIINPDSRVCSRLTPRLRFSLNCTSSTLFPRVTGPRSPSAWSLGPQTPQTRGGAGAGGDMSPSTMLWWLTRLAPRGRAQGRAPSVSSTRNTQLRAAASDASLSILV